jgi:DNA adenine methylase
MLNKTCYNGLYRVSRKTGFNVPQGSYKNPTICDNKNLENVSNMLRHFRPIISTADYRDVLKNAQRHDFVYFDPPYDPKTPTACFTGYTLKGFNQKNQEELVSVFRELAYR